MNPFSLGGLRLRLVVLVLLILTPAVVLVLYNASEERRYEVRHAKEETVAWAQRASLEEQRLLEEGRALLVGLALGLEVQEKVDSGCRELLLRFLDKNPDYRNFGVIEPDGTVRCSAVPFDDSVNLADRDYFRRAVARRGFAIGGYQVGRITGKPTINFGYPILDDAGEVKEVVFAALSLDAMASVGGDHDALLPPGAVLTKMDENGIVLARSLDGKEWVGQKAPEFEVVRASLDQGQGCFRNIAPDGTRCVFSFALVPTWLEGGNVYAVLTIPEAIVFSTVNRKLTRNLLALALAAVLALTIAWLGVEFVVIRPIRSLVAATVKLRGGDWSVRLGPRYQRGQLGELARSFDEMAETLQERQAERDHAVEALRQSERDYRSLVEHAPYGILRSSREGRLLLANPALVKMLGYSSAAEVVGKSLPQEVYMNSEDRPSLYWKYGHQETMPAQRVTWKRKDGKPLLVVIHGRQVRDEKGRFKYFENFVENETQRRSLEDQLRQAQKLEAVGQLAGGVAHDFNNLLGVMLGYSDLLLTDLPPGDPNREKVQEIRRASERAAALTKQLLFISRRQVVEPKPLNLNAIVHGFEGMLQSLVGEDVTLVFQEGKNLPHILADHGQMEQVLMNLVMNARDAMPEGGRVVLRTEDVFVGETPGPGRESLRPGRYVRLLVSDTGTGMDPAVRERIFEPFYTTKKAGKGTGLGLSTVRSIVEASGGCIHVFSEPGRGTRFEIHLPAVEGGQKEQGGRTGKPREGGSETILLVEDEVSLRTMTRRLLESEGYRVLEASSPSDAILQAREHLGTIDLLVTDVVMPQMSGRDVAEKVRRMRAEAKVLFVSGYADDVIIDQGMLIEGVSFLAKPFAPEALLRKVRAVLEERDS